MIPDFERLARQAPKSPCFTFCDSNGEQTVFDFETLRLEAATLVRAFNERGVQRGDHISVDMENCPAFIVTILAAAYAGVTLVLLNHRLTEEEKKERIRDLKAVPGIHLDIHLDEDYVNEMIGQTRGSVWEAVHMAERAGALFDEEAPALVLFTSGTAGRAKAVSLSWKNLCGAAHAANLCLSDFGKGMWQLALPLFHVGGFEIFVRSILNETQFLLYRHFDAERILTDAAGFEATHISVVDKMLQDMIRADKRYLKTYSCILLGGAAINPITLVQAVASGAQLYVSYGMTETSSMIACSLVDGDYDGGLTPLPGYKTHIVLPDEHGVGQLAVSGPGVFSRYLNAKAAFTLDGYFLTGDRAAIEDERIKVKERLGDMFISGGENIYPEEIRRKLLNTPGVEEAYVFGVDDATWGKRPVALVERTEARYLNGQAQESLQTFVSRVYESIESRLSKLYLPKHICALDEFPRSGIGKVDRNQLREIYSQRIEVCEVKIHHIEQELCQPFVTAKTTMTTRESLIIEVIDYAGRVGLGECVAFPTDWYLPETLGQDLQVLQDELIPLVKEAIFLHPREFARYADEHTHVQASMAHAAIETALWDLYGKISEKPLWQLLSDEFSGESVKQTSNIEVPAGLVMGIMPIEETITALREALGFGYTRVKLKIKPGDDYERVRAVREAFPELSILLDANQAYSEHDIDVFKKLDSLNITCIEEPLAPSSQERADSARFFTRLGEFQTQISTPICLDESILNAEDAYQALLVPGLRCFSLKIGKWGGVKKTLDFCRAASKAGAQLWMGGMYETAVSKRLHAAFQVLPSISIPGDLSATDCYFTTEITKPNFTVLHGNITLNTRSYEHGLGCELDYETLKSLLL
ncbi:MAG: o-succinylbenzoate synthase [Raoultibacter sp.]|jgi:O-succinylbenzoate synthase